MRRKLKISHRKRPASSPAPAPTTEATDPREPRPPGPDATSADWAAYAASLGAPVKFDRKTRPTPREIEATAALARARNEELAASAPRGYRWGTTQPRPIDPLPNAGLAGAVSPRAIGPRASDRLAGKRR